LVGSVANLKTIHSQGWTFFTTQQGLLLKSNRKVSLSIETGYINLKDIVWRMQDIRNAMVVKLKAVPLFS
jgi:hypothetical protein